MTRSLTREKTMARTTKTVPADGDRTLVESSPDPEARPSLKAGLGSERIWRMLVETAADGFWLLDAQFRTVFVNPAIEQMLGFTSEEMVGRAWDSFGDAEWMARAKALEERRVSGVKEPHEFLFIRKDGSKVLTRIATTPLYDDKGEFDGALGIVSDITEQKKTGEASLRMSEERYRLLFDRATDGILVLTTEGRIVAANESFARMHGYTAHEMRSMNLKDLDTPASSQRVGERVRRLLAGESLTFEVEHQKKDGQVFPLEVSASLITSSGGDALIQAFHRDITERREAERALRLMRTSVDTASDALFWMVPDGRIVQVNDAACRSLGYTRDELLALCVPDVDAHYTADLWRTHFPALAAAGSLTFESEQRAKDGRLIPVEIVANYVRIGEEEFNCAFVRDITERKLAEERQRAADARFRSWFDLPIVGICITSPTKGWLEINDHLCEMLGYDRRELQGMTWADLTHPEDLTADSIQFERVLRGEIEGYSLEKRFLRKDGRTLPTELSVRCVRNPDGTVNYFVALVADVTARKQVEATHRLESAALQAVANAVVISDRAGVIVWANSAFTASTGFTTDEAIGRMPGELLKSGAHDAAFYRALWDTILAGDVWRGEMMNRRKDGSRYLEEMTITPLKDERGEITHFIAVKQDITERKRLEEQFRQAQKMESVGLLAGGVAHDFNNMLGVILGTAELAIAQVNEGQPLHEDLLEIRKAAIRSADLTRQLLAFARQQTIAPTVLDLNETVPGMLAMLRRLIGEDISLRWQPTAALWPVLLDPSQMDQILTNLCVNARHAIADVGTVTIATANVVVDAAFCAQHAEAVPGDYVRLSVRDTGSGMDAETQARIFEPFFSTKGVGVGTGLGLATVYGAVKQNQGFVTVASTLGEGTTFDIYLPRHEGAATPARKTGPVAADLRGGETILVVEDEPALIRLAAKALEAQGYVVLTATNAADALRLAAANAGEIHLLLSDVVMPGMNGRDLAAALQKLRPALKLLFMSGHTAGIIASRGLLEPELALIEKPFTPVALAAKVREVLDGQ